VVVVVLLLLLLLLLLHLRHNSRRAQVELKFVERV